MTPNPTPLRNQLAKVIKEARRVTGEGAVKALQPLTLDQAACVEAPSKDLRIEEASEWMAVTDIGSRE